MTSLDQQFFNEQSPSSPVDAGPSNLVQSTQPDSNSDVAAVYGSEYPPTQSGYNTEFEEDYHIVVSHGDYLEILVFLPF